MMLSFLVLSGLLSEASLRGVRIERHLPREIFAREKNRVVLRIHNQQARIASLAITLEDRILAPEGDRVAGRSFALRVGPNQSVDRSYAFVPEARGPVDFSGLRVSTRFPFGLFVKSMDLEVPGEALVYPYAPPVALQPDRPNPLAQSDEQIGIATQGDAIGSLREFAPGDPVSRVHWRRSARAQKLLVGEREGEASAEIEVDLHLTPEMPSAALEDRVSHAASLVVSHLEAGLRVGLRSPTARFPAASGIPHRTELLRYLAEATPPASSPTASAAAAPASSHEPKRTHAAAYATASSAESQRQGRAS
ncbi:MAG: DUF58 domain-containing protein [Myxococcota bacterium]